MNIRNAKAKDAVAVARFITMAEGEMAELFAASKDPEVVHAFVERLVSSRRSNRYSLDNNLVAEVDGRVAGSLVHFPADKQPELDVEILEILNARGMQLKELVREGQPGTYYLSTAGVDPEFRGRGVGTALFTAAEDLALRLGFPQTSLLVSEDKPRVRSLYERLGYAVVGEQDIAGYRYYRMVKNIS